MNRMIAVVCSTKPGEPRSTFGNSRTGKAREGEFRCCVCGQVFKPGDPGHKRERT